MDSLEVVRQSSKNVEFEETCLTFINKKAHALD